MLRSPGYLVRGLHYYAAGSFYTPKPIHAVLHVTRQCNSHCVMCSDWLTKSTDEISLAEIENTFSNSIFSSLKTLTLTGGEPSLHHNLAKIVQTILKCCPNIQELALFTNGLEPDLVLHRVQQIVALTEFTHLRRFSISISLDGYGEIHERVRRVPRAFERVVETINRLQEMQRHTAIDLCSTCVVQPGNFLSLMALARFGQELGIPISFVPVWVPDIDSKTPYGDNSPRFTTNDLEQLKLIIEQQLSPYLSFSNAILWEEYFKLKSGKKRRLPCFLVHQNVSIDSDGTMFICSTNEKPIYGNVRKDRPDILWYAKESRALRLRTKRSLCTSCLLGCNTALSLREEFFFGASYFIRHLTMKKLGRHRNLS